MYPFACLFFTIFYWVYKGLLLKYYARTTMFNEDIPIDSVAWINFGLLVHMFISSLMFSNNRFFPDDPDKKDRIDAEAASTVKAGGDTAFSYVDQYSDSNFIKTYFERLANGQQGIYYLTFMVILLVLIIIRLTIFDCLSDIFSFI